MGELTLACPVPLQNYFIDLERGWSWCESC